MPIDAVPLDVGALPGIVCGPIVRRLTRTQVSIWLATVAPDPISLTVREVGGVDAATVTATPARVGSQLWMTVLTADVPGGQFAAGHTYESVRALERALASSRSQWDDATRQTFDQRYAEVVVASGRKVANELSSLAQELAGALVSLA